MNSTRFSGKTIWITGAGTPVGKAVSKRFYSEGANLILSGTDRLPEEIKADSARKIRCDSRTPLTEETAEDVLRDFDTVDILVTADRYVIPVSLLECSVQLYDEIIDQNLTVAFCAARAQAKKNGKTKGGVLLFLSSIHGEKPTGSAFAFSVSQGGLTMLMREAALDMGRLGFRVNMLRYGALDGDEKLFESKISGIYLDMNSRVPRGNAGKEDEIAGVAAFLCSDEASFINGGILTADGGFTGYYMDGDSEKRWDNGFLHGEGGDSFA